VLPDSKRLASPAAGAQVSIHGDRWAPIRYVWVANNAQGTVTVYGGPAGAEALFTVPAGHHKGSPIGEREMVTVQMAADAPAPAATDDVLLCCDVAHLSPTAGAL
jgi:hypothetical protein